MNSGLVHFTWLFDVGSQSHLLLEVDLGDRVVILSILQLFVSLVDQVVACRDMVVTVVLNAFLAVLTFKLEFVKDMVV